MIAPTHTFALPDDIRFTEELGFLLTFYEAIIPGSTEKRCLVQIVEEGDGMDLIEIDDFQSWDEMKQEFPTLLDYLKALARDSKWDSGWRQYDRIYYIQSITGADALYDCSSLVWFDAKDNT